MLICCFVQVTRHEIKDKKAIGTMPEAYPHLVLDNFSSKVFILSFNDNNLLLCLWTFLITTGPAVSLVFILFHNVVIGVQNDFKVFKSVCKINWFRL